MANIIFDFDGTIADSLGLAIHIFEQLLRRGETLPVSEVERLRGMSMVHVAIELRIKPWKVPFLLARGRKIMRRKIGTVQAFDGMTELIDTLHRDGHQLYIMSSNSVQNIRPLLKRYKVYTKFIKLYGSAGLLGKANLLRRMMKRETLDPTDTYYVGDEVRDIEAAKKAGAKSISVTWGYNNEKVLRKHQPDFVAHVPADIAAAVE